jgi:predicted nucleic acid-binding protein
MRYAVDASMTMAWCFREYDSRADVALRLFRAGAETIAPLHWWFEVRNVAMRGIRQQRVSQSEVTAFFQNLVATPVVLDELPNETAVFVLAQRHSLTFYDAAYLELAQREGIALATLDQALARAATAEGVPLIGA